MTADDRENLHELSDGKNTIAFYVDPANNDPISAMIMNKDSSLLAEVQLLLSFCNNKGAFLDIGANLGIYAFVFAVSGFSVYAFEANVDNVCQMEKTKIYNNIELEIIPQAVTEKSGSYYFYKDGPFGFLKNEFVKTDQYTSVEGVSIDDWDKTKLTDVKIIKIDVEGGEIEAIKGMKDLLKRNGNPPIFTEFNGWCLSWTKKTVHDFFGFLGRLGYQPYIIKDCDTVEKVNSVIRPKCVENFLLVHRADKTVLSGKNVTEGCGYTNDLFYQEALTSSSPGEAYYYAWTILNTGELRTNPLLGDFLLHIERFEPPYMAEIYKKLASYR